MSNIDLEQIGKGFRQIREDRQLKREYIACRCGVSASAIAKFEQGKTDLGMSKLIAYLNVMDVTISEFVEILNWRILERQ